MRKSFFIVFTMLFSALITVSCGADSASTNNNSHKNNWRYLIKEDKLSGKKRSTAILDSEGTVAHLQIRIVKDELGLIPNFIYYSLDLIYPGQGSIDIGNSRMGIKFAGETTYTILEYGLSDYRGPDRLVDKLSRTKSFTIMYNNSEYEFNPEKTFNKQEFMGMM